MPQRPDLEPGRPEPHYLELGSTWWPLAWGPCLAAVGLLFDAFLPGPLHLVSWIALAAVAAITAAVPVRARRRLSTVRVTATAVHFGPEALALGDLARVDDVGAPLGARVLGGFTTVPRRTGQVPLRLLDGSTVLGWSRDPDGLRAVLREALDPALR